MGVVRTSVSHVPLGVAPDLQVSPSGSGLSMRVLSLRCFRGGRSAVLTTCCCSVSPSGTLSRNPWCL